MHDFLDIFLVLHNRTLLKSLFLCSSANVGWKQDLEETYKDVHLVESGLVSKELFGLTMPPLSKDAINILKTTAPVVQTEGSKITTRMYEILFTNHPNVKNLFNASHFVRAEETHSVAPQVG